MRNKIDVLPIKPIHTIRSNVFLKRVSQTSVTSQQKGKGHKRQLSRVRYESGTGNRKHTLGKRGNKNQKRRGL